MKLKHFILTSVLAAFLFTGCNDDDDEPFLDAIGVSTAKDSYGEDEGAVAITFSANATLGNDVTITYEVTGTAVSGKDYEALPGTAILTAGTTTATQTLTLLDDGEVEPSEQFILTIKAVDGGGKDVSIGVDKTITLTINDNDSYPFENGILVLHEGNFGGGNASVSFIDDDLNEVQNGIFKSVNEVDAWGDTAQSMAFYEDKAYIVLNGSKKVEVVNRYTFESVATIGGTSESDFLNPRYMAIVDGTGYVTDWGDGSNPDDDFVAIVNLETNTVEDKISVGEGPERLLSKDNMLYVAHQGGWGQNNIISVINTTTKGVSTITVGLTPNSLQMDASGKLWVLSSGYQPWGSPDTNPEVPGQLNRIDVSNNSVDATFDFALTEHPKHLSINEGTLYYYLAGSVFEMEVSATTLPETSIITGLGFYDMAVIQGRLYGVDAKDFKTNGSLEIYDLSNNSLLASKEVSIIPGEVYFTETAERK